MKYELLDTYNFPRGITARSKYYPILQRWLLSDTLLLRVNCNSPREAKSAYYAIQTDLRKRDIEHEIWREGNTVTIVRPKRKIQPDQVFLKIGRPTK